MDMDKIIPAIAINCINIRFVRGETGLFTLKSNKTMGGSAVLASIAADTPASSSMSRSCNVSADGGARQLFTHRSWPALTQFGFT